MLPIFLYKNAVNAVLLFTRGAFGYLYKVVSAGECRFSFKTELVFMVFVLSSKWSNERDINLLTFIYNFEYNKLVILLDKDFEKFYKFNLSCVVNNKEEFEERVKEILDRYKEFWIYLV
jgi:hypothetical protein